MRGGRYVFGWGQFSFEVDPMLGGRIVVWSLDGTNILTGPSVNAENWGSTLWPSPQSRWGWPPPPELDNRPYRAQVIGAELVLDGDVHAGSGLAFSKRFSADATEGVVRIDYGIRNATAAAIDVAAWEVTRVPPGGLTYFPKGDRGYPDLSGVFPSVDVGGVTWFRYDAARIPQDVKLFSDGSEGWIAHAWSGLLFVKSFADVPEPRRAPQEGEIEIYANGAHTYIEIEQQGPYEPLPPRGARSWTVKWYLRKIPPGLKVEVGEAALVAEARRLIGSK